MVSIMEHLHTYVPMKKYMNTQVISSGKEVHIEEAKLHCILMGGDLLTAMRGRSAQQICANACNAATRLEGMQPFALDWHTKMNLLEVNQ